MSQTSLPSYFRFQGFGDSGGNDLSNFASATLLTCSQKCSTFLGCNGFVYTGPDFPDVPNHCFLKSTIVLPLGSWNKEWGLDLSNPLMRTVAVTFRTSVTTGNYETYQSLDPNWQRFTANTWGTSNPTTLTSAPFYLATGCGTSDNPDLVTGEIKASRSNP